MTIIFTHIVLFVHVILYKKGLLNIKNASYMSRLSKQESTYVQYY
jgi:hypothetical protein